MRIFRELTKKLAYLSEKLVMKHCGKDSNFKGVKGKSGDKPDSVKKKAWLEEVIDKGLANSIANEELLKIKEKKKRKLDEMKVVVMPVVLKDMTTKLANPDGSNFSLKFDGVFKIAQQTEGSDIE